MRDLRRVGGELRVDDELQLAGVVAQVDEDEAAVVAARVGSAGDRQALADVLLAGLAEIDVAPAHPRSLAGRSASEIGASRMNAPAPVTRTIVAAPEREAWVIWLFGDRPA